MFAFVALMPQTFRKTVCPSVQRGVITYPLEGTPCCPTVRVVFGLDTSFIYAPITAPSVDVFVPIVTLPFQVAALTPYTAREEEIRKSDNNRKVSVTLLLLLIECKTMNMPPNEIMK